jgi:hypothetical protein
MSFGRQVDGSADPTTSQHPGLVMSPNRISREHTAATIINWLVVITIVEMQRILTNAKLGHRPLPRSTFHGRRAAQEAELLAGPPMSFRWA